MGEICIETRDKAAMSANITAAQRATGIYPIDPSVIPRPNLCSQSANTQGGRSGLQRCDSDGDASCCSYFHSNCLGRLLLCQVHLATLCQPTRMILPWLTTQNSVIKQPSGVLQTNICNVKLSPTKDDKKSATVFQSEPTARKYKKCGLLCLLKWLTCAVLYCGWRHVWEMCAGWMATDKEEFLCLCVKRNFALSYGFIIFSLHCILLV